MFTQWLGQEKRVLSSFLLNFKNGLSYVIGLYLFVRYCVQFTSVSTECEYMQSRTRAACSLAPILPIQPYFGQPWLAGSCLEFPLRAPLYVQSPLKFSRNLSPRFNSLRSICQQLFLSFLKVYEQQSSWKLLIFGSSAIGGKFLLKTYQSIQTLRKVLESPLLSRLIHTDLDVQISLTYQWHFLFVAIRLKL